MKKLKVGDKIKLFGGYDWDPPWLKAHDCFLATILRFFDNGIEKRNGDERLSATIEFDNPITFKNITGKYGVILGRWEGQKWESTGVVHVHLSNTEIFNSKDMNESNSVWMESHASYERVD